MKDRPCPMMAFEFESARPVGPRMPFRYSASQQVHNVLETAVGSMHLQA